MSNRNDNKIKMSIGDIYIFLLVIYHDVTCF